MNKEEIEKIRETLDDYNDLIDYDYGHKDMDLLVDMITNITNVLEKLDKANIEGYSILHAYYGSSVYNTRQMTRLIGLIEQDCKAIGIETLEEKKLKQLLEDWENRK